MNTIYIPFGNDCAVAYQLEKINKRNTSLPFDWIKSDLKGIIKCIQDDFANFLDETNFTMKNTTNTCKIIQDNYSDGKLTNSIRMVNNFYGFHHLHDFKLNITRGITENLSNGFRIFKEKYTRRIERFREIMLDNSIKKIIVHIGPDKDYKLLEELTSLLDSKLYVNYEIIFIKYSEFEKLNTTSWKREEFDWSSVFIY